MLFEGVVEVLRSRVSKFKRDLRGGFLGIEQIAPGETQTLAGQVAEYSSAEGLLETTLEFVFVKADGAGDFAKARRRIDPGVDVVPGGEYFFLVGR